MANEFLQGFAGMQAALQRGRESARKENAYQALRNTYGDIAGDPEAAQALQSIEQGAQAFPLQQQQREQTIAASQQTQSFNAAREAEQTRKTQAGGILSGALYIQNARKRDPNADVGALFDRIVPTLGLSPEDAAAARQALVADPGAADDLVTAFRIRQGVEKGDPSAVEEYKYFSQLPPAEQANYLKVKRSGFNAIRDIGGVPTAIQVAPGATAPTQTPLSTLPAEAAAANTLAGGKAAGTATGKVVGEKVASDLPLSNTEQVKAEQQAAATAQSFDVAEKAIDNALSDTGWLSAGPLSALPDFLNPSAATLRSDLVTVQSKVVLDTITEMKNLSKTGSTGFGQLSDREGQLISSRLGALLQATTPARLRKSLTDLQTQLAASRGRLERAYANDQKARGQGAPPPATPGSRVEGQNVILKWNAEKGDFE